jgi:hypothetical protein
MDKRLVLGGRWIYLVVLLAYIGVAVGMTWPLADQIASALPGHTSDTLVHYWNGWWVQQALSKGQSPFYTTYMFYPNGLSLAYHNFAWLNIAAWLALRSWVGGFVAYNLPFLANLALCGLAAFLLSHDLTGNKRAAFLAGLIYQCWPYRTSQLDHPNLISTQWIPLFLLFLIRVVHRGRWQDSLIMGLFLSLTGYTRLQLLIPAAVVGGVYSICVLPLPRQRAAWRRTASLLLLGGGIATITLAPLALRLVSQQRVAPADLLLEEEESTMQTDLLAYLTPSPDHPALGPLTGSLYDRYYADRSAGRRFSAYVGVTALALMFFGAWSNRRDSLPWIVMALVLFLLALGPVLRLNGRLYPAVPMPYRLADWVYVVRLLRAPDRFNMFLALPVSVLAAHGIARVLASACRRSPRSVTPLSLLMGTAILFEYWIAPVTLQHPEMPVFYSQMAAEPGDFAVLNLPLDWSAKTYMFAQTAHHHPILQGKTARFPEGTFAYLDSHEWLRTMRPFKEIPPDLPDVGRHLASLGEDDVRYVILHKDLVDADQITSWQRYLLVNPRFEDEQIAVYPTVPLAGRDFTLMHPLTPGVGIIHTITSAGCLNPGGVLEVDVGWGASLAPEQDLHVEVSLVAEGGGTVQEGIFLLSPTWPTHKWPAGAVAWGYYTLSVPSALAPGAYAVALALLDPATDESTDSRSVVLERVTVKESPCSFDLPPGADGAVQTNGAFGDALRLLGYRARQEGDDLTLVLYWRAEHRMETDYKVFVHVFDLATKVPVAQDDAMPRRWTYPTSFWGPGEVVDDPIPISLADVPPGTYGLAVGVYDPVTMERLPVIAGDGRLLPDGRLVLPGQMVMVEEHKP